MVAHFGVLLFVCNFTALFLANLLIWFFKQCNSKKQQDINTGNRIDAWVRNIIIATRQPPEQTKQRTRSTTKTSLQTHLKSDKTIQMKLILLNNLASETKLYRFPHKLVNVKNSNSYLRESKTGNDGRYYSSFEGFATT